MTRPTHPSSRNREPADLYAQHHLRARQPLRGRLFEDVLVRLFELAHFDVVKDAGAAAPRQIDLVARYGSQVYLVEAKSTQRAAGLEELDGLRARLRRAAPGAVGVLVSTGGFAGSVPLDLQRDRGQPILLVGGAELERTLRGYQQLRDLLRRKEDAFFVAGIAQIDDKAVSPHEGDGDGPLRRELSVVDLQGNSLPYVQATGGYDPWLPSLQLPDPDWAWLGTSRSVFTRASVPHRSPSTLQDVLEELHRSGWLQSGCSWAIRQAGLNWFGFDLDSLEGALLGWEHRYEQLPGDAHHTEQVAVSGKTDTEGLWIVEADIDGHRPRWVTHCEISLVLDGWPLDVQPLRRLLNALHVAEPHVLRAMNEPTLVREWQPRDHFPRLEAHGWIVLRESATGRPPEEWVVGIVAEHPGRPEIAEEVEASPWRAWTREHDVLPYALRSWHKLDARPREYSLLWCEWSELTGAVPGVLMADWTASAIGAVKSR